jgi:hypothetical protein
LYVLNSFDDPLFKLRCVLFPWFDLHFASFHGDVILRFLWGAKFRGKTTIS